MERFDPLVNEWMVQPNMNVGRDCAGVALVNVSHGSSNSGGGGGGGGSPPGIGRSDSPAMHS